MANHPDYSTFAFMLQGYNSSEQAANSGNSNITYSGWEDRFGAWYIQEQTTVANGTTLSWRYLKGSSNFATTWANRENETYATYPNTFN